MNKLECCGCGSGNNAIKLDSGLPICFACIRKAAISMDSCVKPQYRILQEGVLKENVQ